MGIIQKKCSVCGKVFTTLDNENKYCSAQCAKKANKKKKVRMPAIRNFARGDLRVNLNLAHMVNYNSQT
jgi:predicted nucleic acid-binding Zn ribbon protein